MKKLLSKNSLINENGDLLLLSLFTISIIVDVIFQTKIVFYLAIFLACIGFLLIIQPSVSGSIPDERDKFINYKAGSIAFSSVLAVVALSSFFTNQIEIIKSFQPQTLLHILLVFLYMTYLIIYAILKRYY